MPTVEHSHGPHFPKEHDDKHVKQLDANYERLERNRKEHPGNEGTEEYNRIQHEIAVIKKHINAKHGGSYASV